MVPPTQLVAALELFRLRGWDRRPSRATVNFGSPYDELRSRLRASGSNGGPVRNRVTFLSDGRIVGEGSAAERVGAPERVERRIALQSPEFDPHPRLLRSGCTSYRHAVVHRYRAMHVKDPDLYCTG